MSTEPVTDPSAPSPSCAAARELEPMDPAIRSIQPGGGKCMSIELAWGRMRRWYLRHFRKGYVAKMRACRRGTGGDYPHDILDPRDLKYYGNQGDLHWEVADDPFAWRDRLPFVRVGLGELFIVGSSLLALALALAWVYWPLALIPLVVLAEVAWFFRDPKRTIPSDPGCVVAPADGRICSIRKIDYDEFIGGPAIVVDIFLSIFNVHINRAPAAGHVIGLAYRPGKFLNALRPESARENECLELRLVANEPPYRAYRVRQITGAIARRIVCWARPGTHLQKGAQFGMIKLGSRTELTLAESPGLTLKATVGQKVRAGSTVLARYDDGP